ncbi:MAG: hypothetical protein FWD65_01895 [Coriobacteriia bacterium]|nr:hypothetical protein [Coriobacteriia bacterium]
MKKSLLIQILIYMIMQVIISVLLVQSINVITAAIIAPLLSVLSGVLLVLMCLEITGRLGTFLRIIFIAFGWLVTVFLSPAVSRGGLPTIMETGRQGFPGLLLLVVFLQIATFAAFMTTYSLSLLWGNALRPLINEDESREKRKREAAKSAETGDKLRKVVLVGLPGRLILIVILIGAIMLAGVYLYEHVPFIGHVVSGPTRLMLLLILLIFIPLRNKFYTVCNLSLADGWLHLSSRKGTIIDLPWEGIECCTILRIRPKGFGYILRIQSEQDKRSFLLMSSSFDSSGEVVEGYKGFTLAKLEKDMIDIKQGLKKAGVKSDPSPLDTLLSNLPIVIYVVLILAIVITMMLIFLR